MTDKYEFQGGILLLGKVIWEEVYNHDSTVLAIFYLR
jgi:hypothetical protein